MYLRAIAGLVSLLSTVAATGPAAVSARPLGAHAVFLAGTAAGMFRSIDGGRSWQAADKGLPARAYISVLATNPHNAGAVYAGVWNNGGLYISRDAGLSWHARYLRPGGLADEGFAIDPANTRTMYAAPGGDGVETSNDGGITWTHINGELLASVGTIAVNPRDPAILLAGSNVNGVLRSTDHGRHWKIAGNSPGGAFYALAFNPINPAVAYVATSRGIYETIDDAHTWQAARRGIYGIVDFRSIAVDPHNGANVIAGSHGGDIYHSVDGGTSWTLAANASGFPVYAIAFDPLHSDHILVGDNFGLISSSDHGVTWRTAAALQGHQINVLVAAMP